MMVGEKLQNDGTDAVIAIDEIYRLYIKDGTKNIIMCYLKVKVRTAAPPTYSYTVLMQRGVEMRRWMVV